MGKAGMAPQSAHDRCSTTRGAPIMDPTSKIDPEILRKVYGRGFHDGMRQKGRHMNPSRLSEIERNQTGIAKKVLAAVSAVTPMHISTICTALHDAGTRADQRLVLGCLNGLKDDGLVREPEPHTFIRIIAKEKPKMTIVKPQAEAAKVAADVPPPAQKPAAQQQPDTLGRLGEIASQARAMAATLEQMAESIDAAAIEVEERIKRIEQDMGKLRQLQALLKSIGE